MKKFLLPLQVLLVSCNIQAADPGTPQAAPAYVDEAPLPEGWPKPGPYNEVAEKSYPAYRAAFTGGKGETGAFFTLFAHIKRNDIPMTAPVEMPMSDEGGNLSREGMAFLYQNEKVGRKGTEGTKVEVRDVPAAKSLCYTWQGTDSRENIAKAKAELQSALTARKLESQGFRLLGYNGPGTPRMKRTWELQALLK